MNKNEACRTGYLAQDPPSEGLAQKKRDRGIGTAGKARALFLTSLLAVGTHAVPTIAAPNVVLWNRLGSDSEILHSEIGPGGEKNFGAFTPGPFPNFGQAFVNSDPTSTSYAVTFPAGTVVAKSKGTVALWAKLNNFPSALFDAVTPLVAVPRTSQPRFHWRIGFGRNNGCGGGGFYGTVGVSVNDYCAGLVDTATQDFTQSSTLGSILGNRAAWHHYAMVWNETGIPELGGRKTYLYIDGKLIATPYYHDGSPWGEIPADSRIALAYFYNIRDASLAVDNLIIWDDVKLDFSDRFNENPGGDTFSSFTPRAEFTLGPKANDDSYWVRGWLKLADTSNGIDPLTEAVTIKVGPFSHTLPAGSFAREGDSYVFKGPVRSSLLDVRITGSSTAGGYSFKSCLKKADLESTTLKPEVQLTIGDDSGQATLDVGYAKFGKGSSGKDWVFPPAK